MTACLVREQLYLDIVVKRVLQQINNVAVKRDRHRRLFFHILLGEGKRLRRGSGDVTYPSLGMPCLNAGQIHLGNDADTAGNFNGLRLCAAHAAETARYKQMTRKIPVRRNAEEFPPGIQDRIEGAVNNALRPDVHPAAGRHLTVGRASHCRDACPVMQVVRFADHQAVCDDDTRCLFMGMEETQGMTAHDDQCLRVRQDLKIFFY